MKKKKVIKNDKKEEYQKIIESINNEIIEKNMKELKRKSFYKFLNILMILGYSFLFYVILYVIFGGRDG